MIRYIIKRLLIMIPVIFGVTFLVFTLLYFTPGDPAQMILGNEATEEELEEKREELGLNDPFFVRFADYCYDTFVHFDLGVSYINKRSVQSEILSRFPNTLVLAFLSTLLAGCLGIPLGILAACRQNTWKDKGIMIVALLGVSVPGFLTGLLLSLIFALKLHWLPATGFYGPLYWILPCLSLALSGMGSIARMTRSSMLEVIRQDYITTVRAKGQTEKRIVVSHMLRNALIPVITMMGTTLGYQLSGALVVETVFSIPGLGSYLTASISGRDYPAVQGVVLFCAILFSLVMLGVDLLYAFVDPRIKAQYEKKRKKAGRN